MQVTTISVEIPDVTTLSDEEMAALRLVEDGRWSDLTKRLMESLGATGLDLNPNWAITWQQWECRCCQRKKEHIARVAANGVLLCRLEVHHDHFGDHVGQIFDQHNPMVANDFEHNRALSVARGAAVSLTMRFNPSLLCSDCNAAEGEVKRILGAAVPRHFSFSPREIARFISVSANRRHELMPRTALAIWQECRADIDERSHTATSLAMRAASGRGLGVGSPTGLGFFSDQSYVFGQVAAVLPELRRSSIKTALIARSVSRDSASQSLASTPASMRGPTETEFGTHVETMHQGKHLWDAVGEEWECECCGRSKREILRKSKRGIWTGRVHWLREWTLETDETSLLRRVASGAAPVLSGYKGGGVCQDCRSITTKLQQADAMLPPLHPTLVELKALIADCAPNRDHTIDLNVAQNFLTTATNTIAAVHDFELHREMVDGVYSYYARLTDRGWGHEDALDKIMQHLAHAAHRDDPQFLSWQIAEAERIRSMDNREAEPRKRSVGKE